MPRCRDWNSLQTGRRQFTSCTAAMAGMRSRSFWVTATRTVITLAAGPVMRTCRSHTGIHSRNG